MRRLGVAVWVMIVCAAYASVFLAGKLAALTGGG